MIRFKTNEKTLNKKVKELIAKLSTDAKTLKKVYVSGIGYVNYIKNSYGETIGNVHKDNNQMIIEIK